MMVVRMTSYVGAGGRRSRDEKFVELVAGISCGVEQVRQLLKEGKGHVTLSRYLRKMAAPEQLQVYRSASLN